MYCVYTKKTSIHCSWTALNQVFHRFGGSPTKQNARVRVRESSTLQPRICTTSEGSKSHDENGWFIPPPTTPSRLYPLKHIQRRMYIIYIYNYIHIYKYTVLHICMYIYIYVYIYMISALILNMRVLGGTVTIPPLTYDPHGQDLGSTSIPSHSTTHPMLATGKLETWLTGWWCFAYPSEK
jgi:hypothetical protein